MAQQPISTTVPTAEETFARHAWALRSEQFDDMVATFHDDATVIAQKKVDRGLDSLRQIFTPDSPHAAVDLMRRRE
jgi:hypothetical protein